MGTIPRFSRPGQFDRYCKLVLEYEAVDYLRKMDSLRDCHVSFMNRLATSGRAFFSAVVSSRLRHRFPRHLPVNARQRVRVPFGMEYVENDLAADTEQEEK